MITTQRKITIGIVSPFNPSEFSTYFDKKYQYKVYDNGVCATSVNSLVHGFLKLGYRIIIFTYDRSLKTSVEYHGKLLDVYIIPGRFCKYKLRGMGIILRLYMGARLADIIRTHINELSVLHAHWTYDFADACIPFVKIKPVFCTVRDWCPYIITTMKDLRSKLYWYISKIVFKKVINCKDIHFIANSDYVASRLKSVGIEQVPILPNAITEDFIIKTRMEYPLNHVFISISQKLHAKRKNLNNLLLAFQEYRKADLNSELWLVGDGIEEFKNGVDELLFTKVKFLGKLTRSELKTALDNSSVLVHPSLEETFGNIVLEAMARRVPVIGGKDSGAIPVLLGRGEYGCLCDVKDPHSIYESMLTIIKNKDYRNNLINKSTDYLLKNYLDYKIAQKHIDYYLEYLK